MTTTKNKLTSACYEHTPFQSTACARRQSWHSIIESQDQRLQTHRNCEQKQQSELGLHWILSATAEGNIASQP